MSFEVFVFVVALTSICVLLTTEANFSTELNVVKSDKIDYHANVSSFKSIRKVRNLDESFENDLRPASGVYDRFDWTLIKLFTSSYEKSFLLSPFGLKLTLLLLKEAATGDTAAELSAIFRDDSNYMENRKTIQNITGLSQTAYPDNIAFLNSWIFISKDFEKRQRYQAIGETFYNTELIAVNTQSPIETAKEINSYVLNVTLGNILNAVKKDDVTNMAMLVLNSFYMKGAWRHQFLQSATRASEFYISPTSLKIVPFMNVINNFHYGESTIFDAKILRMPYLQSSRFVMYIIVPNSLSGLQYIVENLSLLPFELRNLQEQYVDLTLPKFKFSYTAYMEDTLKEMDLRIAFEETASFPGIARNQLTNKIKLSKVMQRSIIDINELGCGSSLVKDTSSINKDNIFADKEVVANRPFLFFIRDDSTSQLLLLGKVADPTLTEGVSIRT